jgi:enediyne polyketide synthase
MAIAVIGMACRYPGARNLRDLWENILARRQQFRQLPDVRLPAGSYCDPDRKTPDKSYAQRAAVIDGFDFDWAARRVPKTTFATADTAHWLALDVALAAVADAGYEARRLPNDRTGVVLGNTLTGEKMRSETLRLRWPFVNKAVRAAANAKHLPPQWADEFCEALEDYYKSVFESVTEDSLSGGLSNTIAGRICNYLDLHAGGYVVDGACASSLLAVATAASAIESGDMDVALAGGVDISIDPFEIIGFAKTGALTPTDMRVYDRRGNGFIPGEGCGFVVLKRLDQARADGDYVYAVLKGWGVSSDGKGGLTAPNAHGQANALRIAYQRAGYGPRSCDFIEGHGTGTSVGDRVELEGVALALAADGGAAPRSCAMTSFKSVFGHTKAAAGVGGFIKAVLGVNQRVVPPTAGCAEPNLVFSDKGKALYPAIHGRKEDDRKQMRAGVSAMGFGGINTHATLESADAPKALALTLSEQALFGTWQASEVFVWSGASKSALLQAVNATRHAAAGASIAELVDLAAAIASKVDAEAHWRAAIVAVSPDDLAARCAELAALLENASDVQQTATSTPDGRVWFGSWQARPRIGFLFPGQGSQRLGMGRRLVERYDWARALLDTAERAAGEAGPAIRAGVLCAPETAADEAQLEAWKRALAETRVAQPAICLVSLLWQEFLQRLGVSASAVCGHSLGELSAFHAASAFDADALLRLAALRGRAMSAEGSAAGAMAVLACSLELAERLVSQTRGYVTVANVNSPKEIVVSGEASGIAELLSLAQAEDIRSKRLPVSNAFHSRLVASATQVLRSEARLPVATLGSASRTLISSMTGGVVPAGLPLAEHFAGQVTARVDFVAAAKTLASRCDVLLEVGPGQVLTQLCADIFEASAPRVAALESQPNDDLSLNRALASLFVSGAALELGALYASRLVRPFVPAADKSFIVNPCEREFAPAKSYSAFASPLTASAVPVAAESGNMAELLGQYLSSRGRFLAQVISADLNGGAAAATPQPLLAAQADAQQQRGGQPQPMAAAGTNAPQQLAAQTGSTQRAAHTAAQPHASNGSASAAPLATRDEPQRSHAPSQIPRPRVDRAALRVQIVAELVTLAAARTGFPRESVRPEFKLLDDLNLDSIKAGELIAQAASAFDVGGSIDPVTLANATLIEIAEAIAERASTAAPPAAASQRPVASAPRALSQLDVGAELRRLAAQRTGFPEESIRAELRLLDDLNLDSIKAGELIASASATFGVAGVLDPVTLANASLAAIAEAIAHAAGSLEIAAAPSVAQNPGLDPRAVLIAAVAERTGFPATSIAGSARLLDDLNLDSIKAAEVIAHCAREIGLQEAIDPSPLANFSIDEIAATLRALQGQPAGVAAAAPAVEKPRIDIYDALLSEVASITGFSKSSLTRDTQLATDLSLSVQRITDILERTARRVRKEPRFDPGAMEGRPLSRLAEILANLPDSDAAPEPQAKQLPDQSASWVRDFALNWIAEPLVSHADRRRTEDDFRVAQVLVLCDEDCRELGDAFKSEAATRGARVDLLSYAQAERDGRVRDASYTHVVCVLPAATGCHEAQVRERLQRLRAGALLPSASAAIRRRTSLVYLQLSSHFRMQAGRRSRPNLVGTAAFAASVHHERSDLRVRAIELHPALEPTLAARLAADEMVADAAFANAVYDAEARRWVFEPVLLEPCSYPRRALEWRSDDVVMVTGGGRGITAECALQVARTHRFKTALVGSSKLGSGERSAEIARTLERFAAEGLVVRYYAADLGQRAEVAPLIEKIRAELGPISGVVHGAGLNRPRRAEQATLDEAVAEVAPKLQGAAHLCEALEATPPRLFLALTSIIGVTGMPGNAYYAFSNESLDNLLHSFGQRHPETACTSIAYSVWDEVGMGARMGSTHALGRMGIGAIGVDEGVRRFQRLFDARPPCERVVVTARLGGLDTWRRADAHIARAKRRFDGELVHSEPGVERRTRVHLSHADDPYVADHIFNGSALFPTVFGLEAMAQVAAAALGVESVETFVARDVRLERPLVVDPQRGCTIELRARVLERSSLSDPLEVQVGIGTEQTGFNIDHFSARVSFAPAQAARDSVRAGAPLGIEPRSGLYNEGGVLFQGPLFQRMHELYELARDEATGVGVCRFAVEARSSVPVESQAFGGDLIRTLLLCDPFLFDVALQAGQLVVPQWVMLPVHIGLLEIHMGAGRPDGLCRGELQMHGQHGSIMPCSASIVDGQGRTLLRLVDYQLKVLGRKMSNPTANELANPSARDEQLLHAQTEHWARALGVRAPQLTLGRIANLAQMPREERHLHQKQLVNRAMSALKGRD